MEYLNLYKQLMQRIRDHIEVTYQARGLTDGSAVGFRVGSEVEVEAEIGTETRRDLCYPSEYRIYGRNERYVSNPLLDRRLESQFAFRGQLVFVVFGSSHELLWLLYSSEHARLPAGLCIVFLCEAYALGVFLNCSDSAVEIKENKKPRNQGARQTGALEKEKEKENRIDGSNNGKQELCINFPNTSTGSKSPLGYT